MSVRRSYPTPLLIQYRYDVDGEERYFEYTTLERFAKVISELVHELYRYKPTFSNGWPWDLIKYFQHSKYAYPANILRKWTNVKHAQFTILYFQDLKCYILNHPYLFNTSQNKSIYDEWTMWYNVCDQLYFSALEFAIFVQLFPFGWYWTKSTANFLTNEIANCCFGGVKDFVSSILVQYLIY